MSAVFPENDDSPASSSAAASVPEKQNPIKLNRTCQGCRIRKIRCIVPSAVERPGNGQGCVRCIKLGLGCIFAPPALRAKRKRNETRIKELETKLQQLQAVVDDNDSRSNLSESPSGGLSFPEDGGFLYSPSDILASVAPKFLPGEAFSWGDEIGCDAVDYGIISNETAQELYQTFCQQLVPIYPLLNLPETSTWEDIRRQRPALARAILSSASCSVDPKLFQTLFQEAGKYVANKVVMEGEKSLDLIQALLILAIWCHPPKKFELLKFNQYVNMAATIAIELLSSTEERYKLPPLDALFIPSEETRETWRTFLACYFVSSSIGLAYRRSTVLCHCPWVEDCIKLLESVPVVSLNDRRLIEWTRVQRIAEEGLKALEVNQGSSNPDLRNRLMLRGCAEEVIRWRQIVAQEVIHEPLEMHYHMILVTIHEHVLYDGHGKDDFRPPYTLRSMPLPKTTISDTPIEAAYALSQCLVSAQAIMTSFLNLPTNVLRSVPAVVYTRMSFAMTVLLKLDISLRTRPQTEAHVPDNRTDPKALLIQLVDKLDAAVGREMFSVPAAFSAALLNMTRWYVRHFEQRTGPSIEDDILEPMMHLEV
ncbi:Transcription factor pbcR-like protein [Cladobotryum mycophilum]|uniref:Transcription factor pbcR-like protein n=1 Tax=Cladobotryum mycophilum TaxID=491253 RepID=A0ABR0SWW8_9HYPO